MQEQLPSSISFSLNSYVIFRFAASLRSLAKDESSKNRMPMTPIFHGLSAFIIIIGVPWSL